MAKRVMRSYRRTHRRRGSQLKQRKKRSKLLKRTLKRRNSFRKKNTYKRRKTNMKRGGRPRHSPYLSVKDDSPFKNIENAIKDIDSGNEPARINIIITELMELVKTNDIYVKDESRECKIKRVNPNGVIEFDIDENCKSSNRIRRMFDRGRDIVGMQQRNIWMRVEELFNYNLYRDSSRKDTYVFLKLGRS